MFKKQYMYIRVYRVQKEQCSLLLNLDFNICTSFMNVYVYSIRLGIKCYKYIDIQY